MDELLAQIRAASNASLYYLALAGALMVPDVCAALGEPDGTTNGARYAAWFDRYVAPRYTVGPNRRPSLVGADCYQFRCRFLHQGRLQHAGAGFSRRLLFLEPTSDQLIMHNNVMDDALNIDVRTFCADVIIGANRWRAEVGESPVVQGNMELFVRRHPEGLPPYIIGLPVIA